MGNKTIIPFGPQHPVLPEPIHLDLMLEDETVTQAIPSIGFIHRGLEKLVEKKDYTEFVYVAERICGICSFMHGMGYCMAVENVMQLEVPERALFLRTIWGELSRIQSHLLWLGLMADACGFESLFMHTWRLREEILNLFDLTTGGRIIFAVCKIGGVRKDMPPDMIKHMVDTLEGMKGKLEELTTVFLEDASLQHRLCGLGKLSMAQAVDLGAVGPMAKASGVELDMRLSGYAAYPHLDFAPITHTDGDCYARTFVRVQEIYQSIDLISQAASLVPAGAIDLLVKNNPDGEHFVRVEQPRGEAIYYVKGNGTKFLSRFRVRTPTFANLPALLEAVKGCELADVPVLILTIDPCISCTER